MSDDPDAAYGAISEVAARSLGATVARVWVNDPDAGVLRAAGSFGVQADVEAELLDVRTLRHGAGLPGRVLGTRTPEFIRDAHDDPRWLNGRYIRALDLHAYAGLPLISGGVVTGVLSLMFAGPREFSAQERALAGTLADATAVTVRMDRLHEQRRRGDVQDAVARLANTLGHELNNPLTVVIGHLALLEGMADSETIRRVERARNAAGRLADVVHRLQRITRLEAFRHTSGDLPPMFDIWSTGRD
jgi:GAF domain-containing protein